MDKDDDPTEADLARSNRELEEFASAASHDLQEPLRAIIAYTERLIASLGDRMDPREREWAERIRLGAERMRELIEGVLDLSRVQPEALAFEPTDMAVVLRRALANLSATIEAAGVTVTSDALPELSGDAVQLVRLLQNLIGNAVKFGARSVHVGCRRTEDRWRFSVADDGIGIAPGDAERVFGSFTRLQAKDEYPGAGIGLAICKRIVEAHGGEIWIEPSPEGQRGTTVIFTIPVETASAGSTYG